MRRLQALEGCAAVDTVIFDKTGTLTEDRMDVVMAHVPAGVNRDEVCGMAGALARHSLHPVSRAIAARFPAFREAWVASEVEEVAGRGLRGKVARLDGSDARYLYLGSAFFCRAPAGREDRCCRPTCRTANITWRASSLTRRYGPTRRRR